MDEDEGIRAIIWLQALAGIEETEEEARVGWQGMSVAEQQTTINIYNHLNSVIEKEKVEA